MIQHTPWLFQTHAANIGSGMYKQFPIGAIICLNENNERHFPQSGNDVNFLWCSFNDPGEQLTIEKLTAIVQFAHAFKEKGICVHCYGGANRSSLICSLLIATFENISFEVADERVRQANFRYAPRPELREKMMDLLLSHDLAEVGTGQ